jgi:hypothetical protein
MSDRELIHIDLYSKGGWVYGWLSVAGDHFSIRISKIHKGNISICDLGHIDGIKDIDQVPLSEFSNPEPLYAHVKYQTGNGYVIKLDMERIKKPVYIRLYCGEEIEYYYPITYPIILWRNNRISYPFE